MNHVYHGELSQWPSFEGLYSFHAGCEADMNTYAEAVLAHFIFGMVSVASGKWDVTWMPKNSSDHLGSGRRGPRVEGWTRVNGLGDAISFGLYYQQEPVSYCCDRNATGPFLSHRSSWSPSTPEKHKAHRPSRYIPPYLAPLEEPRVPIKKQT